MKSVVAQAALRYLDVGFSVIPVLPRDKRPLLLWRDFQARRPTRPEVVSWWRRWPEAGVAIVCGRISGLAVLDGDPRNGEGLAALADRLPTTPAVETGGGGWHYYFRLPPGERVGKAPGLLPGVDLQAEASYAIAPPSLHPSGRLYRWLEGHALGEIPLAPLPAIIRQLIAVRENPAADPPPRRYRLNRSALNMDGVLSALDGKRRCGNGWVARCPAHDDHVQSLSVGRGDDGCVLLYCHAGCAFEEIVAALRVEAA